MGFLLKIILFGLVFFYIMRTVGGFMFRIMGGRVRQEQNRYAQPPPKREGEIKVDRNPNDNRKRNSGSSSDGDYIDYEEIK